MTLGELIEFLQAQDSSIVVPKGFAKPHSDRGDYSELAFTPADNVTVASMLSYASSAIGECYEGYKGGSYLMGEWTPVYIGCWGECGEDISLLLMEYMVGKYTNHDAAIATALEEASEDRWHQDYEKRR